MKKALGYLFLSAALIGFSTACNHGVNSPVPTSPIPVNPTSTPTLLPSTTPGCYAASSLPVTQYAYPNPMPSVTPFWTPVVGVPTTTYSGYTDNGSYGAVILKSTADWSSYWAGMNQAAPAPPTDFSSTMVFIPGTYSLLKICYTGSNVLVYQSSGGGGPQKAPTFSPPTTIGTVTPAPTATPTATPSALPRSLFLIPSSNLPVSFISSYLYLY